MCLEQCGVAQVVVLAEVGYVTRSRGSCGRREEMLSTLVVFEYIVTEVTVCCHSEISRVPTVCTRRTSFEHIAQSDHLMYVNHITV